MDCYSLKIEQKGNHSIETLFYLCFFLIIRQLGGYEDSSRVHFHLLVV